MLSVNLDMSHPTYPTTPNIAKLLRDASSSKLLCPLTISSITKRLRKVSVRGGGGRFQRFGKEACQRSRKRGLHIKPLIERKLFESASSNVLSCFR